VAQSLISPIDRPASIAVTEEHLSWDTTSHKMKFLIPSTLLSTAVLAAPYYSLNHLHTSSNKRSEASALSRMSDSDVQNIYKTCWGGNLQWPIAGQPNPVVDVVSPQYSIFPKPAATPNMLTVHNYCSYDIYFKHLGRDSSQESGKITAGTNIVRPLSGTVFKAYKTPAMTQDLLVEYNVIPQTGELWYNLSLLTCMQGGDLSACAGHDGGLQLGNAVSKSFQCAAGTWCDDQAYLYQENLCKKESPVTQCSGNNGLTMEFCANAKH